MSRPTLVDRFWQLAYRSAYPIVRTWWRSRRRVHHGALVALSVGDSVLLVRSSYRPEWSFPGGGVEAGETPAQAAQRELREEIGLVMPVECAPTVVQGDWDGRPEIVHVFEIPLGAAPTLRLDQREVVGARLFTRAELAGLKLSGPARAYFALPAHDQHA